MEPQWPPRMSWKTRSALSRCLTIPFWFRIKDLNYPDHLKNTFCTSEVFLVFHQVAVAYHGFFFGQCFVIRLFPALLWWNCLYISALFSMLWWLWELVKSFFLHRVQQHGLVQWHPLSNCLIFQLLLLRMHRQERQWFICTKHESRE